MKYIFTISNILISFQLSAVLNLRQDIHLNQAGKHELTYKQVLVEKGAKPSSQFIATIPMGTVVNEGGILTRSGYILKDIQTSLRDQHGLKNNKRDINQETPTFFKGRLAVISSSGSENWYHWLLQVLPRLMILAEAKVKYDRIYVNNLVYHWQKDSLKAVLGALNIPEHKLLVVNGDVVMQAETLIVPSVPFIPCKFSHLPYWMTKKLNQIFNKKTKRAELKGYEKIYISRGKASTRRVVNEKQLMSQLQQHGFKNVYLEDLTPHQQAYIFGQARVIVGPHGSGFANLIFAKPGFKLIEIDHGLKGDEQRSFYKGFTRIMKGTYAPFYVDNTNDDHLDDDMYVDVQKLLEVVNGR